MVLNPPDDTPTYATATGGSSSSEADSVLTGDDEEQFGRRESNPVVLA
jgi:hypothetical protein